jgi:predicted metal-dependent peptidase
LNVTARDWEIATMQAVAAAKAAGQLPGAGQWIADQIRRSKINWREVLRDFVNAASRSEVSWVPPNRRYVYQGLYLPGPTGRRMGEMVLLVDTSGSIWGPLLDAFGDELNGILEDMQPEKVHVLYWDAEFQGHAEYEVDDLPVKIEPAGGGGTEFDGVWAWIAQQGIDPACVVALTDLYCSFGEDPGYPVLWCSVAGSVAPFGDIVKLQLP